MIKLPGRFLPFILFCALLFWACPGGAQTAGPSGLRAFLPSPRESGEWKIDGEPQEFKGDDLYLYIDGGAEIYKEYGFVEVLAQEFKNAAGAGLSLEIFRMKDPAAAFGMYSFKRTAKGERVAIGAEGQLEDYYLNFWRDDYLVTITAYGGDGKSREGLLFLARAVAAKMRGAEAPPGLVAELPGEGLIKTGTRYFRGYIGFMNHYPSLGAEKFRVEEGVRGDYASGASLFILRFGGADEAGRVFAAVAKAVQADAKAREFKAAGPLEFSALDDRAHCLTVRAAGRDILICVEPAGGDEAAKLFGLVLKKT